MGVQVTRAVTAKDETLHTQGELVADGRWLQIKGGPTIGITAAAFALISRLEEEANAERLARAWNSLSPNEARIAELEEALRKVERLSTHHGSGSHCTCSQREREAVISAALEPAKAPIQDEEEPDPSRLIECRPCSEAGGAERGVYHLPPACDEPAKAEGNRPCANCHEDDWCDTCLALDAACGLGEGGGITVTRATCPECGRMQPLSESKKYQFVMHTAPNTNDPSGICPGTWILKKEGSR